MEEKLRLLRQRCGLPENGPLDPSSLYARAFKSSGLSLHPIQRPTTSVDSVAMWQPPSGFKLPSAPARSPPHSPPRPLESPRSSPAMPLVVPRPLSFEQHRDQWREQLTGVRSKETAKAARNAAAAAAAQPLASSLSLPRLDQYPEDDNPRAQMERGMRIRTEEQEQQQQQRRQQRRQQQQRRPAPKLAHMQRDSKDSRRSLMSRSSTLPTLRPVRMLSMKDALSSGVQDPTRSTNPTPSRTGGAGSPERSRRGDDRGGDEAAEEQPSPTWRLEARARPKEGSSPEGVVEDEGEDEEDEEEDEDEDEDEGEGVEIGDGNDDTRAAALNGFNSRHTIRSTGARNLLVALHEPRNLAFGPLDDGYGGAVGEVFRNRLYIRETYNPFEAPPPPRARLPKRRRRKKWQLDGSIWYSRKLHGNSKSYYETAACMRTVFETDWEVAGARIAKAVRRADVDGEKWRDADGNGSHDLIDAVGAVLWEYHQVVYGAFDYYCVLFDTGKDAHGEVDIFAMTYNAYSEFARDCGLICARCPLKQLDLIWTTVNALPPDSLLRKLDRFNHKRTMNSQEFLQALVHLALALYGAGGAGSGGAGSGAAVGRAGASRGEVAPALTRLCAKLQAVLPAEALQDSNAFRKQRCYLELTDNALRRHAPSLRSVFDVYARTNRNLSDELQHARTMSVGEWLALLEHTGLLESGQISFFGAKLVFKWSMIRARPDRTSESERKLRQLTFVDWLEALVRLACLMALPTDVQLEASACADAGEFLHGLQDAGELDAFVAANKVGWREPPKQHVSRCVTHLIALLVRTVKHDVNANAPAPALVPAAAQSAAGDGGGGGGTRGAPSQSEGVSEQEAIKFEERRRSGRTLSHVQASAALLDGIRASESIVRGRQLASLRAVEIFGALSDEQMLTLCASMSQAQYLEGEYVFEQGDEGDTFYIIIEGTASVLRTEPGSPELERELGVVGEGAFFGERALLKSQVPPRPPPRAHPRHPRHPRRPPPSSLLFSFPPASLLLLAPHPTAVLPPTHPRPRARAPPQVRYAGVRAESQKLFTMCITRDGFERALHSSLDKLMPDQYHLDEAELVQVLSAVPDPLTPPEPPEPPEPPDPPDPLTPLTP